MAQDRSSTTLLRAAHAAGVTASASQASNATWQMVEALTDAIVAP